MSRPIKIIINPNCHQGRGWKRWLAIKHEVLSCLPDAEEIITGKKEDCDSFIKSLEFKEDTILVSAGGDGSIHNLINAVLKSGFADKAIIGAIGLGSSNDFLKPFKTFIGKIPVRININTAPFYQDAGKVVFVNNPTINNERYFVINSSFGVSAEGNWRFNNPGRLLQWLKKNNTSLAIFFTAISTILSYKNKNCTITYKGKEKPISVSNINILKSPFISGSLYYKQDVRPDDGLLALNICAGMNKKELLKTLIDLEKGKFIPSEKKTSDFIKSFSLRSISPIVFECDGETEIVTKVDISVLPKTLRVLNA